jgi:hypothetical protein
MFVCCCTVALLLLLATLRQQASIAVRAALGAPPLQAAGQALLGAFLLSTVGALLGLALAQGLIVLFNLLAAPSANLRGFWVDVRLDMATLLTAMVAAILAIPLCGAPPAFRAARTDPMVVLRRSAVSGALANAGWPGRLLVAGQIALSCVLLVGAAITTSTGVRLARYSYGFETPPPWACRLSRGGTWPNRTRRTLPPWRWSTRPRQAFPRPRPGRRQAGWDRRLRLGAAGAADNDDGRRRRRRRCHDG